MRINDLVQVKLTAHAYGGQIGRVIQLSAYAITIIVGLVNGLEYTFPAEELTVIPRLLKVGDRVGIICTSYDTHEYDGEFGVISELRSPFLRKGDANGILAWNGPPGHLYQVSLDSTHNLTSITLHELELVKMCSKSKVL